MHDLYLGDCIEIMKAMPDQSLDCIVTDPPYGVGIHFGDYRDTKDNLRRLIRCAFPEMRRVARRVAITCGITNAHLYPEPTWVLAWVYGSPVRNAWGYSHWQPVLVYGNDPDRGLHICRPDVIRGTVVAPDDKNDHPTPKPLSFMRKLVSRVAPSRSDTILDPFMGSGTTGVAAVQLGHHFTGIEVNADYFAIAKHRISRTAPDFPTVTFDLRPSEYSHDDSNS